MKTAIFANDVNLSKLVEMLKICICCKYVSNPHIYLTFAYQYLSSKYMYLPNSLLNSANLELQIYHIFAPFANISKSIFSSSVLHCNLIAVPGYALPLVNDFSLKRSVFVKNMCQCLIVTFKKLIKLLMSFLAQFRNCKVISKSVQINRFNFPVNPFL